MNIKKLFKQIKDSRIFNPYQKQIIDGVCYYTIRSHKARVVYDENMEMFVGSFDELKGMTCFFSYYESDIPSFGDQALQNYLAFCRANGLDPLKG